MPALEHHAPGGGPSMAVCAWCGQGFSAPNFHAVGTWSIAVNGSCVFTTPSRTTGGRQRPAYVQFETRLGRLPGARRLSPWPTARRVCSSECLAKARSREMAMLDEVPRVQFTKTRAELQFLAAGSSREHTSGLQSLSPIDRRFLAEERAGSDDVHDANRFLATSTRLDEQSAGSAGKWLGVLRVRVDDATNLVTHAVGSSAERDGKNACCVAVFGRQKRSTGQHVVLVCIAHPA